MEGLLKASPSITNLALTLNLITTTQRQTSWRGQRLTRIEIRQDSDGQGAHAYFRLNVLRGNHGDSQPALFATNSTQNLHFTKCPSLSSRSRTLRAASAVAPLSLSLTVSSLRTCARHSGMRYSAAYGQSKQVFSNRLQKIDAKAPNEPVQKRLTSYPEIPLPLFVHDT